MVGPASCVVGPTAHLLGGCKLPHCHARYIEQHSTGVNILCVTLLLVRLVDDFASWMPALLHNPLQLECRMHFQAVVEAHFA